MGGNAGRSVVIVGGGIGGLACALAFARRGARATVVEQAPALTEIGAGLQITPNGAAVLAGLGLDRAASATGLRARAVAPHDGLTGRCLARFDLTARPGHPYRFCHRADLIEILAGAAQAAGITLLTGNAVTATGPGPQVALSNGGGLAADLVVGADGIHSLLRPALNGPDQPFFTGQVAWRSLVRLDAPPEARIWMLPGRHVVTYPLGNGLCNIVAVRAQADWAPEGWTIPDAPAALQGVFADACPELRAILARVSETRLWGLLRHPVAARWQDGTRAILGDAAHPTLPFLAQGANLALEDAYVLARTCDEAPTLAEGLARYQAARAPRVRRAIAAANANAVNYHLSGPRRALAHAGLHALGRVAPDAILRRLDWLYGHDVTA